MRLVRALLLTTALIAPAGHAFAEDAALDAAPSGEIIVTGTMDTATTSATGLPLTIKETPQSVTVFTRDRIEDFGLTNINDLLDQVPGINVERVETDRTQYDSRGFDVTSFQVDGIGLPLISAGIQFGDLDTALWERVEAVRGANAMMTGVGNPSATINYVRKRPTPMFQASLSAQAGSWGDKRIEADISGPLNASGTVQARAIFAHEDHDSYLDFNKVNRNVYGALLSWDVTPHLKATVGYSRQQNDSDGVLWGALPLSYSDGTQITYPRSASTSAPWTYWNVRDQTAFGELAYGFDNGWSLKGVFTYRRFQEHAKLLYAVGYPDRDTGLGIVGTSGIYPSDYKQYLIDGYASGPLHLFGREHQLTFGVSTGKSDGKEYEGYSNGEVAYPDLRTWGQSTIIPEFDYPDPILQSNTTDRITRLYGAARINLSDQLKGIVGASATWLKSTGTSYDTDQSRRNSKVSPYIGALYDLTRNVTVYASYTSIFNPQIEVDINNRKLDPATGTSIEAGIKSEWFDKRLYATAALFRAKQKGLATYAGDFGPDAPNGPIGSSYYTGVDTTSKGFELELAGRITDRWSLSGGYTALWLKGEDGTNPRPYLPTRTLKLATTYTVPELNDLKLGAQLRWQNGIHYVDSGVQSADGADAIVRQRAYAVVDLMAGIRVIDHLKATLNVRNVGNRKYLGSLLWGQAYYAAPRNVSFTLALDF